MPMLRNIAVEYNANGAFNQCGAGLLLCEQLLNIALSNVSTDRYIRRYCSLFIYISIHIARLKRGHASSPPNSVMAIALNPQLPSPIKSIQSNK